LALGAAACQSADTASGREADSAEPAPQSNGKPRSPSIDIQTLVDISAPDGWSKAADEGGARWSSPKGDVQLFFGSIEPSEKPRAVIEAIAAKWGVSDIHWNDEQRVAIGAERLPATAADGSCKTRAGDATIAYSTADAGRTGVLVAYVLG